MSMVLYSSFSSYATSIQAEYKPFSNMFVHVAVDEDYITHKPKYLAFTKADENGKFTLNYTSTDSVEKIFVKTCDQIFYLYAFKNGSYVVSLEALKDAPLLDNKKQLKAKVLQESLPAINKEIQQVDSVFDDFISKNYQKFVHPRSIKQASDTFKIKLNSFIQKFSNYAKQHAHYAFATLDNAAGFREKYFYKKYTINELASINKNAYYSYINEHYKNYLQQELNSVCMGNSQQLINDQPNAKDLLAKLTKCDTLLSNDSLREWLFISELNKLYYKRGYKKQSIEMMLRYLAFNSTFKSTRKAASNIVETLTRLGIGSKVPLFELPNVKGDTIKLSQYKGDLVYLCFANFDNFDFQTQVAILERLQLLYDRKIHIVTITLSNDMRQMIALNQQRRFSETILNGYNNVSLKEAYNIDVLPKYLLIDADGDVLKNQACSPTDGIEEILKQALKK